jgi:hypothetical protein
MKTAIYIEDGVVQLVLTPESEWEKNALKSFEDKPTATQIFTGAFYDCRGGWVRQSRYFDGPYGESSERSLILRTDCSPPQRQRSGEKP